MLIETNLRKKKIWERKKNIESNSIKFSWTHFHFLQVPLLANTKRKKKKIWKNRKKNRKKKFEKKIEKENNSKKIKKKSEKKIIILEQKKKRKVARGKKKTKKLIKNYFFQFLYENALKIWERIRNAKKKLKNRLKFYYNFDYLTILFLYKKTHLQYGETYSLGPVE